MLHAGAVIELQILFDLRFALALGGLIDRELHALVAVRHHLRHQRRVFRADVFVIEMFEQPETHHVAIEIHPAIHLAPAHVADHVIDVLQARRAARRCRRLRRPGSPAEIRPDSRCARRKCEWYRRRSQWPRGEPRRFRRGVSPARAHCSRPGWLSRAMPAPRHPPRARYRERRLHDADMIGDRMIGPQRRSQHQTNFILHQDDRKPGRACRFQGRDTPPGEIRKPER